MRKFYVLAIALVATVSFVACDGVKKDAEQVGTEVEGEVVEEATSINIPIDSLKDATNATISQTATNVEEGAKDAAGNVVDKTKDIAKDAANKTKEVVKDAKTDVKKEASKLGDKLK